MIPLFDSLIYPRVTLFREVKDSDDNSRYRGSLGASRYLIARMALGLLFSALGMVTCALVSLLLIKDRTSILVQIPAQLIIAFSECLVAISGLPTAQIKQFCFSFSYVSLCRIAIDCC